jgi:hypothetical protein
MGVPCPVPFYCFVMVITTLCWLITVTKFRGLDCKRLSCVSNKPKTNLKKRQIKQIQSLTFFFIILRDTFRPVLAKI